MTTARRVTMHEARGLFAAGRTVLVSENGHRETIPVGPSTTRHTRETIAWDDLVDQVRQWRGRYPRQRFYVVDVTLYRIEATRAGYRQDVESTADLATFATSVRNDRYPGARITESRYAFPGTLYQVKYGARVVANIYPTPKNMES